jgi:hypothetical protein
MRISHPRKVRLAINQLEERTTPVFAKWPFAGGPGVDSLIGVYGQYQDLKDYGKLGDVTTATGYDTFIHFHEGIDIASSKGTGQVVRAVATGWVHEIRIAAKSFDSFIVIRDDEEATTDLFHPKWHKSGRLN